MNFVENEREQRPKSEPSKEHDTAAEGSDVRDITVTLAERWSAL